MHGLESCPTVEINSIEHKQYNKQLSGEIFRTCWPETISKEDKSGRRGGGRPWA